MLSQDKSSTESGCCFYLQKVAVEQQAIRKAPEGYLLQKTVACRIPNPRRFSYCMICCAYIPQF